MTTTMRRRVLTAILLLSPALFSGAASACPNCKESIKENDAEQVAALPGGFNSSIYVMLGGVFVVGGLVVRMIVKETRS
jgi:hypothetical protein